MPEQGPPGPLRTHKGVFAAHRVEIAAPQQAVVVILGDERQHLQLQVAALRHKARLQIASFTQPLAQIAENASARYQQLGHLRIYGQRIQPLAQPGILVGEQ
ncbi:hypothetical protein D3C86_1272750 [compost metagenome]